MPSSSFVGGWTITNWNPDSNHVQNGIPPNGFRQDGPLDIAPEPISSSDTFRLDWLNDNGDPCSVSGLHPAPEFPMPTLHGEDLLVSFGTTNVSCNLTLALIDGALSGSISVAGSAREKDGPDTGSGTFTAEANPGGTVDARKH
jgi:hypothetical protein